MTTLLSMCTFKYKHIQYVADGTGEKLIISLRQFHIIRLQPVDQNQPEDAYDAY